MSHTKKFLTAGAAAAATVLSIGMMQAPASAAPSVPAPGALTLFSEASFDAPRTAVYETVPAECTVVPFDAHMELNLTETAILIWRTTDCTGPAYTFPANDLHSFVNWPGRSFRAQG